MEPKTTGKRIVSKGAYTANIGKMAALSSFGLVCLAVGNLTGFFMLMMLGDLAGPDVADWDAPDKGLLRHWLPIVAGICVVSLYLAFRALKKVIRIDPGIPLTRANTADLPAPDTLVRASEEPRQAHEAVLLRAATETVENHEEQLLRATGLPE